jgi:hypothetical protein
MRAAIRRAQNLRPIGRGGALRLIVQRRDGRLNLKWADRPSRQRATQQRLALRNGRAIPAGSILFVQRNQLATRAGARVATRVGVQHEREQACHLGLIGQETGEHARHANRLIRQIDAIHVRRCLRCSPH